jgi:DNA-binding transcriptional ArsR family regulator
MFGEDMASLKARFFKALSDKSRIIILEVLTENGCMSVGDICRKTEMEQNTASHHLGFLHTCGLVKTDKKGKHVFYALNGETAKKLLFLSEHHVRSLAEKVISERG